MCAPPRRPRTRRGRSTRGSGTCRGSGLWSSAARAPTTRTASRRQGRLQPGPRSTPAWPTSMRMVEAIAHAGRCVRPVQWTPFALLLRALIWRYETASGALRGENAALKRATQGRDLAEFDRNIGSSVRSDRPRGRDVTVRAEDVGAVLCAVHEHRVELRVVDAARPPADVLADLRAEVAAQVLLHAAVMLERNVG